MSELIKYVEVCVTNEEDVGKVLGVKPENNDVESGRLNKAEYESVVEQIYCNYGCNKVAITLRESYSSSINGWSAVLYDEGVHQAFYSLQYDIQIVDRVGGGDSFIAGIILKSGGNGRVLR